jgi:uncharacterized protein
VDLASSEQTVGSLLFFLLLLLFVIWVARRNGFFHLPPADQVIPVTWLHTLGALAVYFVCAILLLPVILIVEAYWLGGDIKAIRHLPDLWKGWAQIATLTALFFLLLFYCSRLKREARDYIFWGGLQKNGPRVLQSVEMGVVAWVVSYPFVLVSGVIASALSNWIWGKSQHEQVAVAQLKQSMGNTPLFIAMIVLVVIIVPFIEELLFRGFLQNVLKRYLGRGLGIGATALAFAFAHYAPSQGVGNFQLIFSLIILAVFLGYIYEREKTLWAPLALHMSFNALNALMIVLTP